MVSVLDKASAIEDAEMPNVDPVNVLIFAVAVELGVMETVGAALGVECPVAQENKTETERATTRARELTLLRIMPPPFLIRNWLRIWFILAGVSRPICG